MQTLADKFLEWAGPTKNGNPSRYDLYWHIFRRLPDSNSFWVEINILAGKLDGDRRQMIHYLLMGAVQYLVLDEPREPLAAYFPASPAHNPNLSRAEAGTVFWEFYQRRREEIWNMVQTREVQINKLGRLALFAPLFLEIARRSSKPLAFVDVGCSVGFGLLWPQFSFHYPGHGKIIAGEAFSELSRSIEGTPSISLNGKLPEPSFLCGIETAPLSPTCDKDVRWLFALTAPHDEDGRKNLRAGLEAVARVKPRIEQGCVLDVLPRLEHEWADGDNLVVYHSMTMHHLRAEKKQAFHRVLTHLSKQRRVFEVGVEWAEQSPPNPQAKKSVELTLCEWKAHGAVVEQIGKTDPSADGSFIEFE